MAATGASLPCKAKLVLFLIVQAMGASNPFAYISAFDGDLACISWRPVQNIYSLSVHPRRQQLSEMSIVFAVDLGIGFANAFVFADDTNPRSVQSLRQRVIVPKVRRQSSPKIFSPVLRSDETRRVDLCHIPI
jgi:hypothetical protein